ncbi:hypothetical protein B1R32_101241 [Abditibacterium utsteinense]|uniref:DUF5666 domain-containing protein n=1 Tax=Abditibacterium utsteinense TaxID=1960156 RepID=A0A2S8SXL7_9BACT|nr:hypothetical protein [Abditibacterium utsteinense]PQV65499.1 hypothetical protein B1R32_101241 [Abditibacterium utsteinense]
MKISIRRSQIAVALLGTLAAPFLVSTAQAAPPRTAPAYGYRNKNNRAVRNITVAGVVTRDLAGNDRFTVRLDNGRTTEVISRNREPIRLSRGDRVELRGDFEKQLFIADSVRILNNAGNNAGQQTMLSGRVTRDFSGRDFELRRDNGQTTRVRSLRPEPVRLTNGDRVTVRGHFEGALFVASNVDIQRNDDRQKVNFPGTVIRRVESGRLVVRGDNGRTYTVISNASLSRFDHNDRVRVRGFINGSIVSADSVVLLKNR